MKVTGDNSISKYIKISLIGVLIFGCIVILFLPIVVKYYIEILRLDLAKYYWSCLVLLYLSGFPMLIIVYEFIKLFDSLTKSTPFIVENVKHLKVASICSGIICIEYIFGIYIFKSIFTLIIVGIFLIAYLGLYILSELFKQAIKFKEENDLTI